MSVGSVAVVDSWAVLAFLRAVATARVEHGTILTGDPEILALPREVVRVVKLER